MTNIEEMLDTHPWPGHVDRAVLAKCIEECFACSMTCTSCADACLSEERVAELRKCIRLNLDCADVCATTGRLLTRQTEYDAPLSKAMLQTCREAAITCKRECDRHAERHAHCKTCSDACGRCAKSCDELLAAMK